MRTAIALVLALAGHARADSVGVVVTGEATLQPQLAAQLEGWLHDHGRTVMPAALEPEAINTLIDCFVLEDLNCARKVIEARAKAATVVYSRVEASSTSDGSREIAITGYWLQKNHESIAERRVCKKCSDQAMHVTVEDLMLALVHDPPPPAPSTLPPPEPAAETEEPAALRTLPIALMAGGGLGVVTGVVLLAIDQNPDPKGPQEPTYRDTTAAGVVIGVAGLAALGAGIYLFVTGKHDSAPVATLTHGGAVFGLSGRF